MGFRRSKEVSLDKRRYEQFRRDNVELFRDVGIPGYLVDDHANFIYFLNHGGTWPNAPVRFAILDLDAEHYALWQQLVDRYFALGFTDPGIRCFTSTQDLNDLAQKYPEQFAGRINLMNRHHDDDE